MKLGILNNMLENIDYSFCFAEEVMPITCKTSGNPANNESLYFDWQTVRNMPVSVEFSFGKTCFVDRIVVECSDKTELTSLIVKDKRDTLFTYRAQTNMSITQKSIVLEAGSLTDSLELVFTCDFSDLVINKVTFYGAFEEKTDLFPTPSKSNILDETADASLFNSVFVCCDKARKGASVLCEKFFEITGIKVSEKDNGCVIFKEDSNIKADGYRLTVNGKGAEISASNERGFVIAAESFIKLCSYDSVTLAEIDDEPMCQFRGVHLYVPGYANLDFARRLIKYMISPMGYNNIIFNIAGGMEYESHPEINEAVCHAVEMNAKGKWPTFPFGNVADGSYLKKNDLKEFLDYVRSFGISVIPEIQSLGHVQYLTQAFPEIAEIDPEVEKKKIDTRAEDAKPNEFYYHSYCPSNPKSYEILFDIIDEVIEVFKPEEYVHMGHDEVYQLGVCPVCKKKDAAKLYSDDVIKIYNYLKEKGMKMILWADMIQPVTHYASRPAIDMIPKDILMLDFVWYFWLNEDIEENLLNKGFTVGIGNLYSSHFPRFESRIRKEGMIGGQISTWTPTEELRMQKEGKFYDILMTAQMLWSDAYKKEFTLTYDRMISRMIPYIRQNLKGIKYPSLRDGSIKENIIKNDVEFPPVFPVNQITSFDIDGNYSSIIFSHTQLKRMTKMPWVLCEEIGKYVITYNDNSTEEIIITSSGNIGYWNRRQNEAHKHQLYRHNGYTAVYFTDGVLQKTADGENVTFYNLEFVIPEGKRAVKVDLVENKDFDTGIFLREVIGIKR